MWSQHILQKAIRCNNRAKYTLACSRKNVEFGNESLAFPPWYKKGTARFNKLISVRVANRDNQDHVTEFVWNPKNDLETFFHLSLTSDIQMYFVTCYSAHRAWREALIFSNISIVFRPLVNYSGDIQGSIGCYTSPRIGDDFLAIFLPRYLGRRRWTFHSTVQCHGLVSTSYCVLGFLAEA